jgi:catechol 2,3-dioxygenase-like lactoylglutathione lyase family enzyme
MTLERIGHVLLRVVDIERAKAFYCGILGFNLREQDPDHGGVFLGLEHSSHTIDLIQAGESRASAGEGGGSDDLSARGAPGLGHIAFQVDTEEALRKSYFELKDRGVEVLRLMDHVSQKSIYFRDPDGNMLEIYYELPNALGLFLRGRGDRDAPFTFDPPPQKPT